MCNKCCQFYLWKVIFPSKVESSSKTWTKKWTQTRCFKRREIRVRDKKLQRIPKKTKQHE